MYCNDCVSRNCSSFCRRNRILRDTKGDIPIQLELIDGDLYFSFDYTYNGKETHHREFLCKVEKRQWSDVRSQLSESIERKNKRLASGNYI